MRLFFTTCLFILPVLVLGCNVVKNPDENSTPDKRRNGAMEFHIGLTTSDSLNYEAGDKTDWKYFSVSSEGIIDITFAFENRKARGTVNVRDARGLLITAMEDQESPLMKQQFHAEPGYYYLEIWCMREKTQYTVEVQFTPL